MKDACPEKEVLIEEIRVVIDRMAALHSDELESVLRGKFDTGDYTQQKLAELREIKSALIERYRTHVMSHGC